MRRAALIALLVLVGVLGARAQTAPIPERDPNIALYRTLGVRSVRTWVPTDTLATKPERCDVWDTTLFEYTPRHTKKVFFSYDPTSVEDVVNTFHCTPKDSGDVVPTSMKTPDGHTVYADIPSDFTPDDTTITIYDTAGYLVARIVSNIGRGPYHDTRYWLFDSAHRITTIARYGYRGLADSTIYTYDAHGNLTQVVTLETKLKPLTGGKFGMVPDGVSRHERNYTYDSLDRFTDSRVYTTNDRHVRRYYYPNDTTRGKAPDIILDSEVLDNAGKVIISVHTRSGRYMNRIEKDSAEHLVYMEDSGPGGDIKHTVTYDSLGRPVHSTILRYHGTQSTLTEYRYQSNGLPSETIITEFRDKKLTAMRHAKYLYTYTTAKRRKK